jgi:hypothetical protein
MNVLKELEQRLLKDPQASENLILGNLVKALCMGENFKLIELYDLNHTDFELALKVMKNWRTSRYTKTRDRIKGMVEEPAAE